MRQFIRHPTDIPIRLEKSENAEGKLPKEVDTNIRNISHGGLACITSRPFAVGESVKASISLGKSVFNICTEVMWCHYDDLGYEVGLRFLNSEDAFAFRMVEQVCHIEHYKREVLINEGRLLTGEKAAEEWISRFANGFPEQHSSSDE
jgi:hypothetical protein